MANGSLRIGGNAHFGGGANWNANTAGLMLECADNTEIMIHDWGHRSMSFLYYTCGANNYYE